MTVDFKKLFTILIILSVTVLAAQETSVQSSIESAAKYLSRDLDSTWIFANAAVRALSGTGSDTSLARALFLRGRARHLQFEYSEAMVDYQQALKYVDSRNQTTLYGELYERIGDCYSGLDKPDSALISLRRGADFWKREGNPSEQATLIMDMGIIHWRMNEFIEAISYMDEAIPLLKQNEDIAGLGRAYNNLGVLTMGLGAFNEAIISYEMAEDYARKEKNFGRLILILNNLGLVHEKTDRAEKALPLYREAYSLMDSTGYVLAEAYTYYNLGKALATIGKTDSAIIMLQGAMDMYRSIKSDNGIGISHLEQARVFCQLKEYDRASGHIAEAESYFIRAGQKRSLAEMYYEKAELQYQIGGLSGSALNALEKSIEICKAETYRDQLALDYGMLADWYNRDGQYRKAFDFLEKKLAVRETIFQETFDKTSNLAQMRIQSERTLRENAELKNDRELQQKNIEQYKLRQRSGIAVIFLILLILAVIIRYYLSQRRLSRKLSAQNAEIKKVNEELSHALANIKELKGLMPICSSCKKIRDDEGYWNEVESYISKHTDAMFSHGICPSCMAKLYPEFVKEDSEQS